MPSHARRRIVAVSECGSRQCWSRHWPSAVLHPIRIGRCAFWGLSRARLQALAVFWKVLLLSILRLFCLRSSSLVGTTAAKLCLCGDLLGLFVI